MYLSERKIIFPIDIYTRIMHYVRGVSGEISGFCKTTLAADKKSGADHENVLVTDVRIFQQECGPANTLLTEDALARFVVGLHRSKQSPLDWNLWWHSHVDFNTNFSTIDDGVIARLSKKSPLVSVCFNKFGDWSSRIDEGSRLVEYQPQVIIDLPDNDTPLRREIRKEIRSKVTERTYDEIEKDLPSVYARPPRPITTGYGLGTGYRHFDSEGYSEDYGADAAVGDYPIREVGRNPHFARWSWSSR